MPAGQLTGNFNPELVSILARVMEDEKAFDPALFRQFPMEVILDYVRRTHSFYIFRKLPEIEQSIDILLKDYANQHPLLPILKDFYNRYQQHLTGHIRQEENELLPYIDYLITGAITFDPLEHFIRTTEYSLRHFMEHHHDTEMEISEIRKTINGYNPPPTNQTPYRILLSQLEMLEKDLSVHALVEDQVLLPRSLQLEGQLSEMLEKHAQLN